MNHSCTGGGGGGPTVARASHADVAAVAGIVNARARQVGVPGVSGFGCGGGTKSWSKILAKCRRRRELKMMAVAGRGLPLKPSIAETTMSLAMSRYTSAVFEFEPKTRSGLGILGEGAGKEETRTGLSRRTIRFVRQIVGRTWGDTGWRIPNENPQPGRMRPWSLHWRISFSSICHGEPVPEGTQMAKRKKEPGEGRGGGPTRRRWREPCEGRVTGMAGTYRSLRRARCAARRPRCEGKTTKHAKADGRQGWWGGTGQSAGEKLAGRGRAPAPPLPATARPHACGFVRDPEKQAADGRRSSRRLKFCTAVLGVEVTGSADGETHRLLSGRTRTATDTDSDMVRVRP